MYIIDELIKIIELFLKKKNIEKIIEIKTLLRKNALIIQEYSGDDNTDELNEELKNNFEAIYNIIIKEEIMDKNDNDFYDKLRHIYFKEIRKLNIPEYLYNILEKILESDEIIKNSGGVLRLLLKNYVKKDYAANLKLILNSIDKEYNIINLLDKNINNKFFLSETLLYFFEKNALNYFDSVINTKKEITNKYKNKETIKIKLDNEPLWILKDCYEFLDYYINKPKTVENKLKEIYKLFCLGYIKSFIHTFIKSFEEEFDDDENKKCNEASNIINVINESNPIYKMIRIYTYKILYNNFGVDVLVDIKMIEKYRLREYNDFSQFIQTKELINMSRIEYTIKTLENGKYNRANSVIADYTKDKFKKREINPLDFDLDEYGIDNFYVISYNLVLSNLQMENRDL